MNAITSRRWLKLGLIFRPGSYDWLHTHAQNPLPESLGGGFFRVYFSSRDSRNRAHGGYFIFHIERPTEIIKLSPKPVIGLGSVGAFDDAGVMPSGLITTGGKRMLFYTGWSKTVDVPFAFHIGLAISTDGEVYERISKAPVLGRNYFDPYIVGAPYVIEEGEKLRMWYVSCTEWVSDLEVKTPKHYYTIKHAESLDGITWKCSDHLCIPYCQDEYAIARPIVWKQGKKYFMWFSYRGGQNSYRIGTAESLDGIDWKRDDDHLGIDVSSSGWDSEMICYAHPIFYNGQTYALYNGNSYGSTGIGLALLK
jgi:hypothetical protein